MKIYLDEKRRRTLSSAYNELLNLNRLIKPRSAKRGEPTTISASLEFFHSSFLPWSIRDL